MFLATSRYGCLGRYFWQSCQRHNRKLGLAIPTFYSSDLTMPISKERNIDVTSISLVPIEEILILIHSSFAYVHFFKANVKSVLKFISLFTYERVQERRIGSLLQVSIKFILQTFRKVGKQQLKS